MASTITLDPGAGNATLEFDFDTPQEFYYEWEVADNALNTLKSGKGQWDGATSFGLGDPAALTGNNLNIYWGVIDPAGAGNNFKATATVSQGGNECQDVQVFTGNSQANLYNDTTEAEFTN